MKKRAPISSLPPALPSNKDRYDEPKDLEKEEEEEFHSRLHLLAKLETGPIQNAFKFEEEELYDEISSKETTPFTIDLARLNTVLSSRSTDSFPNSTSSTSSSFSTQSIHPNSSSLLSQSISTPLEASNSMTPSSHSLNRKGIKHETHTLTIPIPLQEKAVLDPSLQIDSKYTLNPSSSSSLNASYSSSVSSSPDKMVDFKKTEQKGFKKEKQKNGNEVVNQNEFNNIDSNNKMNASVEAWLDAFLENDENVT